MAGYILAIDQGTTSSRVIISDKLGKPITTAQQEIIQSFPRDGWVEHEPHELWDKTIELIHQALRQANLTAKDLIGITNQRETTIVWDADTGKAIYPAIVWQDRWTAETVIFPLGICTIPVKAAVFFCILNLRWVAACNYA